MPVFVDESLRGGRYLLCAVTVDDSRLKVTRQGLRELRKPGQRRIHMKHEGDRRRRQILSAVVTMGVTARMYEVDGRSQSARTARDECLRVLADELMRAPVGRLVLEACEQDHADRQVIHEVVVKHSSDLTYEHARPADEPLLWLPDIIGWAYGKSAEWRRRVEVLVRDL